MKRIFWIMMLLVLGCQQQVEESLEQESIEISSGEVIIEEIDEEFDDGLDEALEGLEIVEAISS